MTTYGADSNAQEHTVPTTRFDVLQATCPSRSVLARVVSKWAVLVIVALEGRSLRFGEIQNEVKGISPKVLTSTLRGLERDGILWRTEIPGVPAHVEYGLSPLGRSLHDPLAVLQVWAQTHAQEVLDARREYDSASAHSQRQRSTARPSSAACPPSPAPG